MLRLPALLIVLFAWTASGCAVVYYDRETGTQHLYGVGHLAIRVAPPAEGVQAVVTEVETLGIGAGSVAQGGYVTLGWQQSQTLSVIEENTSVRLEWPTDKPMDVRVGVGFPGLRTIDQESDEKELSPCRVQ